MTAHSSRLPMGLEPLIEEAKERMRRRRSLVALLLAFAGLAVCLTFIVRPSAPGPGAPRSLSSSERAGGLKISVPAGLRSYYVPIGIGASHPLIGHLLTDVRLPAHANIWTVLGRWGESGPPANGVALKLQRWFSPGPVAPPGADRLHLPLTLGQPWFQEKLKDGAVGYRWGYLTFHNVEYQVMYWSGPNAPAADRAAILRALGSIRPAR
jgi:hypothetical protein